MTTYIIRRLFMVIPILLGAATIVFALMFIVPGDPARLLMGQHGDEQTIATIRKELGLDEPVYIQYAKFIGRLARGDLGMSYRQKRPVAQIIRERFPATAKLAVVSMFIAVIIGVAAGILAASFRNTVLDWLVMVFSLSGISMPVFWLGMMLILVFASGLGWLPVGGYGRSGDIRHIALPALSLAAISVGYIARMMRSSMLEVIGKDYIRTARAKGLSRKAVILRHALKNAFIPVITIIGINFASLLGGAVATETVFAWPGLGRATVDAIRVRDLPVVEGCVMFLAFIFVIANLLVDLSYAWLDPRIRLDGSTEGS
ncbi:MAG: ABC transporter permease [Candidatus Latescibacteria bacterium]|nr:ABC transporter permease [Candidatus Latescibacterota bacterium]